MRFADRLYSLALRAYPRDFRDDNREEVLGTIADLRDAGEARGVLRQTISLGYSGNRLRWLHATGGSIAQTFRQGLAWGTLILIARQAGLGLQELFMQWYYPFGHPSLAGIALTAGWLLVFVLLVGRRRKWELLLLGVVMAGFVAERVAFSLTYGGRFVWRFTFQFFLPTIVPLLFAYLRPAKPVRASWRLGAALLVLAAAIPAVTLMFGPYLTDYPGLTHYFPQLSLRAASYVAWGIEFGSYLLLGVFVFLTSLSDPRWAVAATLLVFVRLIDEFVSEIGRVLGFSGYSGVLMLALLIPAGALLLSFWARRRAIPRRC